MDVFVVLFPVPRIPFQRCGDDFVIDVTGKAVTYGVLVVELLCDVAGVGPR